MEGPELYVSPYPECEDCYKLWTENRDLRKRVGELEDILRECRMFLDAVVHEDDADGGPLREAVKALLKEQGGEQDEGHN